MKKEIFLIMGLIIMVTSAATNSASTIFSPSDEEGIHTNIITINDQKDLPLPKNNDKGFMEQNEDGWFYYPALSNYAPKGMPDFDQKQNNWKDPNTGGWVFCGAVAFANVLWYLDCMYSDQNCTPGDGRDICPIVQDYKAPSTPDPGPFYDDHNYNNVNDPESPWDRAEMIIGNELIEKAAWYCDTQGIRTGEDRIGTCAPNMHEGAVLWLQDCGLGDYFDIMYYTADLPLDHLDDPDKYINENLRFEQLANHIMQGHFVNIIIKTYRSNGNFVTGHFVTIAGINTITCEIAYSDPYRDMVQYFSPYAHNDASKISHDVYQVANVSPSFEIVSHAGWSTFTTLVDSAVIIIPPENGLPLQPLKPMKPQGPSTGKKGQEYTFMSTTTHPLNKDLYYLFDWGDNTNSGWLGPYTSGEECSTNHTWMSKGSYDIKVQAKDIDGIESPWSEPLSFSITKNKNVFFHLMDFIFKRMQNNRSFIKFVVGGL